jgi:hypothetical protein
MTVESAEDFQDRLQAAVHFDYVKDRLQFYSPDNAYSPSVPEVFVGETVAPMEEEYRGSAEYREVVRPTFPEQEVVMFASVVVLPAGHPVKDEHLLGRRRRTFMLPEVDHRLSWSAEFPTELCSSRVRGPCNRQELFVHFLKRVFLLCSQTYGKCLFHISTNETHIKLADGVPDAGVDDMALSRWVHDHSAAGALGGHKLRNRKRWEDPLLDENMYAILYPTLLRQFSVVSHHAQGHTILFFPREIERDNNPVYFLWDTFGSDLRSHGIRMGLATSDEIASELLHTPVCWSHWKRATKGATEDHMCSGMSHQEFFTDLLNKILDANVDGRGIGVMWVNSFVPLQILSDNLDLDIRFDESSDEDEYE